VWSERMGFTAGSELRRSAGRIKLGIRSAPGVPARTAGRRHKGERGEALGVHGWVRGTLL
jgi:hypothetical protein